MAQRKFAYVPIHITSHISCAYLLLHELVFLNTLAKSSEARFHVFHLYENRE